jgi:hypothetical protein
MPYILFERESADVHFVLWRSEEIDHLPYLSLKGSLSRQLAFCGPIAGKQRADLVEELNQVHVVFLLPEVFLEEMVDGCFEHEGVVDRDVADSGLE